MATQTLDPRKTALLVGDLLADVQDLEAQIVFLKAERDTYREMLLTSQEQLHLAQLCLRRRPVAREMAALVDTVQVALADDEVTS